MDYDHVKKQLGYGIQTESKDNAIKAIEQLAARVRELEEERRKVIEALDGYYFSGLSVSYSVKELVTGYKDRNRAAATFMSQLNETEQQLAASQAYAEQLRSIIWETNQYIDQTYSDLIGNLSSEWLAARYIDDLSPKLGKALAIHRDTSALDAYVAEKMMETYIPVTIDYRDGAKVAELEEENARLKSLATTKGAMWLLADQLKQLAAEQLNNKLLRDALEFFFPDWKTYDHLSWKYKAKEALSIPASREALDKYVAEKVKEATTGHVEDIRFKSKEIEELRRIRMARFNNEDCWIFQGDGEDHLESLSCPVVVYPHVLMTITRQRDLAIEALKKTRGALAYVKANGRDNPNLMESTAWHGLAAADKALAIIKESEVK